nr:GTPase [Marinicella sp. W31]MDC2878086.1 50S ribosome-binding GTPase [Marinicella sp. W31]
MSFKVAIVGRPNVGKSTLFNRLVGQKLALVDDTPGVTRDRRPGEARLYDLRFTIIDTAGLEEAAADTLPGRMRAQTEAAIDEADLSLFLVDAKAGLTPADETLSQMLRRRASPLCWWPTRRKPAAPMADFTMPSHSGSVNRARFPLNTVRA